MATHAAGSDSSSLMNGQDYRDSLRKYKPTVYVDGCLIESVADAPRCSPASTQLPLPMTSRLTQPGLR
jgi:4-hydroxybutyryl-CoA dehydratase/vinylacetyl-CoA-Delta-isomerase